MGTKGVKHYLIGDYGDKNVIATENRNSIGSPIFAYDSRFPIHNYGISPIWEKGICIFNAISKNSGPR